MHKKFALTLINRLQCKILFFKYGYYAENYICKVLQKYNIHRLLTLFQQFLFL